jgi:hypothetical protein
LGKNVLAVEIHQSSGNSSDLSFDLELIGGLQSEVATVRLDLRGPLLGDTNNDSVVDIVDLNNVRNNFGGDGLGDTDGNGVVNIIDLNNVRNNFGAVGPAVLSVASATPAAALFTTEVRETPSARQRDASRDLVFTLRPRKSRELQLDLGNHWDTAILGWLDERR